MKIAREIKKKAFHEKLVWNARPKVDSGIINDFAFYVRVNSAIYLRKQSDSIEEKLKVI